MKKISVVALFAILGLAYFVDQSDAVCCDKPCGKICNRMSNKCHDCVTSAAFQCCGHGSCNIFCCNCDGGCRAGVDCWNCDCPTSYLAAFYGPDPSKAAMRNPHEEDESQEYLAGVIEEADQDGDGRLNYEEATKWLDASKPGLALTVPSFHLELKKLDTNGDGYLDKREIDP